MKCGFFLDFFLSNDLIRFFPMHLFNNKSPKRIKNTNPLVKFDKNGNIIREKKTENPNLEELKQKLSEIEEDKKKSKLKQKNNKDKIGNGKQTKEKPAQNENSDDDGDTYDEAVPYDFPGDIIISIKKQINCVLDFITGKDEYGNSTKTENEEKKKRRIRINRNTRIGKAVGSVLDFFYDTKERYMKLPKRVKILAVTGIFAFAALIAVFAFNLWMAGFSDTSRTVQISHESRSELEDFLDKKYQNKRTLDLKPLPYNVTKKNLDVRAGAAILVDTSNGCILYEKNADKLIPPASITKLFVMYIVYQEIDKGNFSMDDEVPLPEMSWAVNQPRDASLMHLGQGQKVTLRELMKGLAVASGNDAAKAIAYYISGSPEKFVARMNDECKKLGLNNTHFVEPSGYDENNITTARELATFARIYITKYPECLTDFHSQKYIDYPLKENLPSWQKGMGDTLAVHQVNTNPLLGLMDGVDGIKTGFIYESGYNLALTAKRGEQRFLSITMQGKGHGTREGNAGRIHDGTEMMEWAFSTFADYVPEKNGELLFPVPSLASKDNIGRFVNLVPAWTNPIPVPHIIGETAKDSANAVTYTLTLPPYIYGSVNMGDTYGYITYKIGDITLEKVPLVADRTLQTGNLTSRFFGTLAKLKLGKSKTE